MTTVTYKDITSLDQAHFPLAKVTKVKFVNVPLSVQKQILRVYNLDK